MFDYLKHGCLHSLVVFADFFIFVFSLCVDERGVCFLQFCLLFVPFLVVLVIVAKSRDRSKLSFDSLLQFLALLLKPLQVFLQA